MKSGVAKIGGMGKNQSGFTMVELIIVFGIIIALGAILMKGILPGISSYKTTRYQEQVKVISQMVGKAADINGNYTAVTNTLLTSDYKATTSDLSSPWGKTITVTGDAYSYSLSTPNVPKDNCIELKQKYDAAVMTGPATCAAGDTNTVVLRFGS